MDLWRLLSPKSRGKPGGCREARRRKEDHDENRTGPRIRSASTASSNDGEPGWEKGRARYRPGRSSCRSTLPLSPIFFSEHRSACGGRRGSGLDARANLNCAGVLNPVESGVAPRRDGRWRAFFLNDPELTGPPVSPLLLRPTLQSDHARIKSLADRLINGINERVDLVVRNGDPNGYPGCVNLSFSYVEGESLLMALKSIALSSGSACTSASLEPSYVLRSLGADEAMAHSSLRFGIGRFTTEQEIDFVVEKIVAVVTKLREMSPLWEMVQEGIDINTIEWSQ